MGFQVWSVISFVVLLILAWAIGRGSGRGHLGILIDSRYRYSLTHFQLVLWTIVILSSFIGIVISERFASEAFKIPAQLLGLMGISAGSAVLSTGVKGIKDVSPTADVARAGRLTVQRVVRAGRVVEKKDDEIKPKFSQIWLEEEGEYADQVVSITKFQNFIFTLLIVGYYIVAALKIGGFPKLSNDILYLIGIANAGYVGGKVPEKK